MVTTNLDPAQVDRAAMYLLRLAYELRLVRNQPPVNAAEARIYEYERRMAEARLPASEQVLTKVVADLIAAADERRDLFAKLVAAEFADELHKALQSLSRRRSPLTHAERTESTKVATAKASEVAARFGHALSRHVKEPDALIAEVVAETLSGRSGLRRSIFGSVARAARTGGTFDADTLLNVLRNIAKEGARGGKIRSRAEAEATVTDETLLIAELLQYVRTTMQRFAEVERREDLGLPLDGGEHFEPQQPGSGG